MSTTPIERRTFPWGRMLGAAAFAVGASTMWPFVLDRVVAGGGVFHAVATAAVLAVVGCGWRVHAAWMPAGCASLYAFGLSAGTIGGAITGVV